MGSRWSKSKETLSKDERYQAVPREDRETIFRTFVADSQVRSFLQSCYQPAGMHQALLAVHMHPLTGTLVLLADHTLKQKIALRF